MSSTSGSTELSIYIPMVKTPQSLEMSGASNTKTRYRNHEMCNVLCIETLIQINYAENIWYRCGM